MSDCRERVRAGFEGQPFMGLIGARLGDVDEGRAAFNVSTWPDVEDGDDAGETVRDAKTWRERRRPEILRLFETQVYGRSPGRASRRPDS